MIVIAQLLLSASLLGQASGLLAILRDAQEANLDRYRAGELRSVRRSRQLGEVEFHDRVETHLIWTGDRSWSKLKVWERHTHEIDPGQKATREEEWIVSAKQSILYSPDQRLVLIQPLTRRELPEGVCPVPSRSWFGPTGLEPAQWKNFLTPRSSRTLPEIRVEQKSADIVTFFRNDTSPAGRVRLDCSLSRDGNVIEYEIDGDTSGLRVRGKHEWTRDASGVLYLARGSSDITQSVDGRAVRRVSDIETLYFDGNVQVAPARFTVESLQLPTGVTVVDQVTGRNRRTGNAPVEEIVERLDELIEILKTDGFSAISE